MPQPIFTLVNPKLPYRYQPTLPRWHPNSWKLYHRSTAKGTASLPQPSDGLILETGSRPDGHLTRYSAIQTHPSCRFHIAVDFPGLRRSGSSP